MAPGQKRSRGNRSVCNACIGREVEGSRRRMRSRHLGLREAFEDKINHSPNRGGHRGFISFLIVSGRGRWTGRRRPRWGSLKRVITRRSTGRVLTSRWSIVPWSETLSLWKGGIPWSESLSLWRGGPPWGEFHSLWRRGPPWSESHSLWRGGTPWGESHSLWRGGTPWGKSHSLRRRGLPWTGSPTVAIFVASSESVVIALLWKATVMRKIAGGVTWTTTILRGRTRPGWQARSFERWRIWTWRTGSFSWRSNPWRSEDWRTPTATRSESLTWLCKS